MFGTSEDGFYRSAKNANNVFYAEHPIFSFASLLYFNAPSRNVIEGFRLVSHSLR
jgi:hypothetical protein